MAKTLILLFHPDLAQSRTNSALAKAASTLPDTEVVDMGAQYPDGRIDSQTEVTRLLAADRIVLQFPVMWYSTPPLLKAWQDAVLTRMFYVDYDGEGRLLKGKPLMVAATAGNVPAAYSAAGQNLYPLEDLLAPLHAMAHRCGLVWTAPFIVYGANKPTGTEQAAAGQAYAARLRS